MSARESLNSTAPSQLEQGTMPLIADLPVVSDAFAGDLPGGAANAARRNPAWTSQSVPGRALIAASPRRDRASDPRETARSAPIGASSRSDCASDPREAVRSALIGGSSRSDFASDPRDAARSAQSEPIAASSRSDCASDPREAVRSALIGASSRSDFASDPREAACSSQPAPLAASVRPQRPPRTASHRTPLLAVALLSAACATAPAPAPAPTSVTVVGPGLTSSSTKSEPRAGFFPLPAALAVDPRALPIVPLQLDVKRPEKLVLDNGLTLYLATERTAPLVTVRALVLAGTHDDAATTLGTADLTFDLLASGGAGALSAEAVDLLLEQSAVNAGGGAGDEYSQLYFNARSQDLGRFFPLFADMLRKPRFEKARFEVELASRLESIRRRPDRAEGLAARALNKAVFGPTSVLGREGTEATYKAVTLEGLKAFHARWVTPKNTVLLVSGDFSREALLSLVKANLGSWTGGERNARTYASSAPLVRRVLLVPKQVAQAKVRIGGFGYARRSPKEYAMRLANTALGTFGIGRLYKEIRDEKGLAYSAFSSVSPGPTTGSFTVGFDTRPELVGQALEAALGILQGVKSAQAPITAAELSSASDIALNTFAFRFDGAAKLVQEKAVFDLFGYPDDYLDRFRAKVLAVDVGLANAAAAELAAPEGLQIVVVGPPEKLGDLAKFGPLTLINDVEAFR